MAPTCVELDLLLQRGAAGYTLALRAQVPDSAISIDVPAIALPGLTPDDPELLALSINPPAYGKHLSALLFADPQIRSTFVQARSVAETRDIPLCIRFWIAPDAPELHNLSWETLHDPERGSLLCTSERVLFSRYLSSNDWRAVQLAARPQLRALIAIANPRGLDQYRPGGQPLTPIDVAGELARARAGLGAISIVELAAHGQATLDAIVAGMHSGCHILYLVCHGALIEGVPRLWLENAQGNAAVTDGRDLAARVREMARPPLLVVLVSCQSGGTGEREALVALGPQLAAAGVPAVLAMQGNVSMATMAAFVPAFFAELQQDGQIDRAVAVARGKVRQEPDAWMPVLWMRLNDGRLWQAGDTYQTDHHIHLSLTELRLRTSTSQRKVLTAIWRHFCDHNQWIPVRVLHHQLSGKEKVRPLLEQLGGSIIFECQQNGITSYQLTFLGVLLTEEGEQYEQLLVDYLMYIVNRCNEDPHYSLVTSQEIVDAFNLTSGQSILLYHLIERGQFWSQDLSFQTPNWNAGIPDDIEDLPNNLYLYVRNRAMEYYDQAIPLAEIPRSTYLLDKQYGSKREKQLSNTNTSIEIIGRNTHQNKPLRVFLCHSSSDKLTVRELYQSLHADGFAPWLDEEDLIPGQDWQQEIAKAVHTSDIVIVCLSRASITKAGYVQKEIKFALDVADEQPEGTIFLIPLRLEDCEVPNRLRRWHWVNLFDENGYNRLVRALQLRANNL